MKEFFLYFAIRDKPYRLQDSLPCKAGIASGPILCSPGTRSTLRPHGQVQLQQSGLGCRSMALRGDESRNLMKLVDFSLLEIYTTQDLHDFVWVR